MAIFITGGTGYVGGYVVDRLLREPGTRLALLIRAPTPAAAAERLWAGLQLHMDARRFWESLDRISFVLGDLHAHDLGLDAARRAALVRSTESVIHIAASLNRKSERACLNTNLRGTLHVVELARAAREHHGLLRFSHVSTVGVSGVRAHEVVEEDRAIEWDRPDYDAYGRTKKLAEYLVSELLEGTPLTFFRPSIVLGDATRAETTQFDMVRAVCLLADLPVLPLRPESRVDIVNADFVGKAIAALHLRPRLDHRIYHLAAGTQSCTVEAIAGALAQGLGRRLRLAPRLEGAFGRAFAVMEALPGRNAVTRAGALMRVFWPYITYDTVFDNHRVVAELGEAPVPFTAYGAPLCRFAEANRFAYPRRPLPPRPVSMAVPGAPPASG